VGTDARSPIEMVKDVLAVAAPGDIDASDGGRLLAGAACPPR
jgi:hypothetical protein